MRDDPRRSGRQCPRARPRLPLYGPHATIFGGFERAYACDFAHEFVPQIETLEALVDARTRAIVVNFPSNPTGATLTIAQRDELIEFARRHDLWIISDEVYDRIIYDRPHVSFLTPDYDKVLMVNSFSKTFAMTGWRIGYVLSPHTEAMQLIMKLQYYVTACSNDAMQRAVLVALEHASDYPNQMVAAFRARRDVMVRRLNAMPGVSCHKPEGAFYVSPRWTSEGSEGSEGSAARTLPWRSWPTAFSAAPARRSGSPVTDIFASPTPPRWRTSNADWT
ncbi:MAG: aminotransferase class I/II-fold pyridoxal phosphate-dependent enzyme [Ardenticatenales bacterium]|nr:aminotransferase class I/II-fold pyridoxal phosphate-dependent enzyme [Ardenticatenales bacterium]